MSVDMRLFSLSMRSLYAEKAVGTDEEVAKEFRKLRDDTRNDAMVYIEGILPIKAEFVTSISEFFDYFDALTFDEWCESIPTIRKEAAEYKKLCMTLLKLHHDILVPLKKRRDQAGILMNAMEKKTKKEVDELRQKVKGMSVDMRLFSLSMRSLYAEKAVGTDEEVAKEFRKLRDDTRNDAMVYIEGILSITAEFVTSISEFFDYFDALTFDEWCESIPTIRKEAAEYKKLCMTLLKLHHDILVPLKKRRDQAGILVRKIANLASQFEKKKAALEKEAAFIDGISKAAGFFSVMEHELQKFENNTKKSEDDPKFIFFKVMKVEARDMKSICQVFYAALLEVKTDFDAMPTEGTDRNYVDEWLEKQKKTIQEECKGKLAKNMLSAIAQAVEKN
ncbi:hypothetical protein AWC38_SpisGene24396 [Stylophora pistillata]|uniref:Uncharacterized protein n=1 Tax=Stylophora pistillata TaxID=50429 RepID=A0A2B4R5X6_STYPI|nr:hypothetical protein AWC38_SpisGene24396 [Stylophora pistillata]